MIYLDNAATTRPDGECLKKAEKYLFDGFYNPSALYAEGYNLQLELKSARKNVLSLIAPADYELAFTSCGTESDNAALKGVNLRGNLVTTMGEHSAVYNTALQLKQSGVDVRFASLNADGSVNRDSLLSLVDENTSIVSVVHVNNETGAINDINLLAMDVKQKSKRALFHSDGVQAFGKIPYKIAKEIDLYSVSAHKIGGIKGCGALFKKKSLILKPLICGGGQEQGLRSGTENVFGIKMFEFAAQKKYSRIEENYKKVGELKNLAISLMDKSLFEVISPDSGSPYILSVTAPGVRGETILHEADDRGLIIGTGSACSSNQKKRYSRVILACGLSEYKADGILRLSFCPENTAEEIKKAVEILNEIVSNRKNIMA